MAVLTPFVGRAKPAANVIEASGAFVGHRSVINLSQKKDQRIEKQLAGCMKEIQKLMKSARKKPETQR